MEPESSSPYSQVAATSLYPEPTPSSHHNPLPLPEDASKDIATILKRIVILKSSLFGDVTQQQ